MQVELQERKPLLCNKRRYIRVVHVSKEDMSSAFRKLEKKWSERNIGQGLRITTHPERQELFHITIKGSEFLREEKLVKKMSDLQASLISIFSEIDENKKINVMAGEGDGEIE